MLPGSEYLLEIVKREYERLREFMGNEEREKLCSGAAKELEAVKRIHHIDGPAAELLGILIEISWYQRANDLCVEALRKGKPGIVFYTFPEITEKAIRKHVMEKYSMLER